MSDEEFSLAADFAALGTTGASEPEKKESESDPEQPQPDTAEKPEEHVETHSEGEPTEAETPEGEKPEEEEAESVEEAPAKPKGEEEEIEVELPDGSVEKVLLAELKKGYQRQSDYTRKTTEAAEKLRASEAEIDSIKQQNLAILKATNARYEQLNPIGILQQQRKAAAEIGDVDEMNRLDIAIINTRDQLRALKADEESQERELQAKTEENTRAYLAEQHKQLSSKIPGFSDPAKRDAIRSTVSKGLQKLGYTEEEISKLGDHRAALGGYYIGKYFESLEAQPKAAQVLKGKAVAPTPGARKANPAGKLDAAMKQFDRNPNEEGSLAALFGAI